jgi:obg-like ATPase 1
MVRAFDDAEVIHVEGDVDPIRDIEIISTELRLKDIEWVEKHLDNLKKTNRSLGNTSLADKAKKQEMAIIEKIYKVLTEENKDVRKADWNNKEVCSIDSVTPMIGRKRVSLETQLVEAGVTPQIAL